MTLAALAEARQKVYNLEQWLFMIERRLVGRRFVDFHPDAAHPLYPNEIERRLAKRRSGDRDGVPGGVDALFPGQRRRPPILFNGIVRCQNCGCELRRTRNLSREGRRHFIVEHSARFGNAPRCRCEREGSSAIEWILQAGSE